MMEKTTIHASYHLNILQTKFKNRTFCKPFSRERCLLPRLFINGTVMYDHSYGKNTIIKILNGTNSSISKINTNSGNNAIDVSERKHTRSLAHWEFRIEIIHLRRLFFTAFRTKKRKYKSAIKCAS